MLNLHPDAAMVVLALPKGPGHTTVVSEYLFRPETIADPAFAPEPVVELWDLISKPGLVGLRTRPDRRGLARLQARRVPSTRTGSCSTFNEHYRREMGRPSLD